MEILLHLTIVMAIVMPQLHKHLLVDILLILLHGQVAYQDKAQQIFVRERIL